MKEMFILAIGIFIGGYLAEHTYKPMLISCQDTNRELTEQTDLKINNTIRLAEKVQERQHKCSQVLASLGLAYNILGKGEREDK